MNRIFSRIYKFQKYLDYLDREKKKEKEKDLIF